MALSNSSSKSAFGFAKSSRFGDKYTSKTGKIRRKRLLDHSSFLSVPSMYTPSPGMYNVGSIFGNDRRYNRNKI